MTTTSFTINAILDNMTDVMSQLLASGIDVNAICDDYNRTYLMFAKTPEMTRILLDAGANPNASDHIGYTHLMHFTHSHSRLEITKLLLDAGANPNAKSKSDVTALMLSGSPQVTSLLLAAGALVNDRDTFGATALYYSPSYDISSLLLLAGADVNASLDNGSSPLMRSKNANMTALLINAGADVNAKLVSGDTALMLANSPLITALLLSAGADVNAQNDIGHTALMTNYYYNYVAGRFVNEHNCKETFFHFLLAYEADVNIRDRLGKTVLDIIMQRGCDLHTLLLLIAAGAFLHNTVFDFNSLWVSSLDKKLIIHALLSAHASFSNLPPHFLPSPLDLLNARLQIQSTLLQLSSLRSLLYFRDIRYRATQVCIALQDLQLPALVTLHILQHLDPKAYKVRMAALWDLITSVKHFHDHF